MAVAETAAAGAVLGAAAAAGARWDDGRLGERNVYAVMS